MSFQHPGTFWFSQAEWLGYAGPTEYARRYHHPMDQAAVLNHQPLAPVTHSKSQIYPLVMTNIAMEAMALIEIDGLPVYRS
jgi:hypothetical protein